MVYTSPSLIFLGPNPVVVYIRLIGLMNLIEQHSGVLELYKWFATKTRLGHWKAKFTPSFSMWMHFSEMCSPRRAGKRAPLNGKIPKSLDLIDCKWFHPFPHVNSMPQTPQMDGNMSATCLWARPIPFCMFLFSCVVPEGPRNRKKAHLDPIDCTMVLLIFPHAMNDIQ